MPELVAIWTAVSSEEQADPDLPSLDEQERACREYCERNGDTVVRVFRAEGFSRFEDSLLRMVESCPAYGELVEMIDSGQVTKVVCNWYHRLWRTAALQSALSALADSRDVLLFSITEPIQRGAAQTAMWVRAISGLRSEQEIIDFVDKKRMGQRGRARAGKTISTRRPYAYRLDGSGKERRLVPVPEEAAWLVQIMELRARGAGYKAIAHELQCRGSRNPNRPDGVWTVSAIRYIVHNPLYAGRVLLHEWPRRPKAPRRGPPIIHEAAGAHEALISPELWQAVQRVNESGARDYTRSGVVRLYSGLCRCGYCGGAMSYRYGGARPTAGALCCARYIRNGGPKSERKPDSCRYNGHRVRRVHRAVLAALREALADPERWAAAQRDESRAQERAREIERLERALAGLDLRRHNLVEVIESARNGQDRAAFVVRYDALGEEQARIQAQLRALRAIDESIETTRVRLTAWRHAAETLERWSEVELRPLLRQLVDAIVLEQGRAPVVILAGMK